MNKYYIKYLVNYITWTGTCNLHFYIPSHFLLSFSQKVRALGLPAVNLMQVDRVRHTLSKGNHTATLRLLSPLRHLYVYALFSQS